MPGAPVVSAAAVLYWPWAQASRKACAVGSAEGSPLMIPLVDAAHQDGGRQPGSAQLQLPRPRTQAAHQPPGAAPQRYAPAGGKLRIALD